MRAQVTIEIARTPEEVFAYLTDVSNLPAWQSGVSRAQIEDAGPPRAGARIRESRTFLGRELNTTLAIDAYEPPRVFALRALNSAVPFTVRHELEPSGGGTRLTVVGEGDVAALRGFAGKLMAARRAEGRLRKDCERLRRVLES